MGNQENQEPKEIVIPPGFEIISQWQRRVKGTEKWYECVSGPIDYGSEVEIQQVAILRKKKEKLQCYKNCGNTKSSGGNDPICLNCGSSIKSPSPPLRRLVAQELLDFLKDQYSVHMSAVVLCAIGEAERLLKVEKDNIMKAWGQGWEDRGKDYGGNTEHVDGYDYLKQTYQP